jgi:hypothetical protein
MTEEKQPTSPLGEKLLDASCKVTLSPRPEAEDGEVEVWSNGLIVKPKSGRTLYIPFVEIQTIKPADYRIAVRTSAGRDVTISQAGPKFDTLAQKLVESWGDALSKALLMHEPVVVFEARADYAWKSGGRQPSGSCRGADIPDKSCRPTDRGYPSQAPVLLNPISESRQLQNYNRNEGRRDD